MDSRRLNEVANKVRIQRVMDRIHLLANMAQDPAGGVSRLAFTDQESAAMGLVARWMEEAGLTVAYDGLGSMYGSTDGNATGAAVAGAGSHLDSVPNGGPYDGVLGVVGAIEALEAMRSASFRPAVPLEVVVWRCEEAALFGQGRLGSLFYSGELTLDTVRGWEKPDLPLAAHLERASRQAQRAGGRRFCRFLELHIEQGRRLEAAGIAVGAVTAIPGASRWRVTISGRADHSGATPMGMRRDALAAAAEFALAVEAAGMKEMENEVVATATDLRCLPGAWNVVTGWAQLLTDVRGIEQGSIDRTLTSLRQAACDIALKRKVEIEIEEASGGKPVLLNEEMVAQVENRARELGLSVMRMPSGAGHDAQTIAAYTPTGMVFVPSIDGVSHAPGEKTNPEDIEAGVKVLAGTWASLAE